MWAPLKDGQGGRSQTASRVAGGDAEVVATLEVRGVEMENDC